MARFLAGCDGVPAEVRSRLLGLAACLLQLGSSRCPASLPAAAEDPVAEVYAGRPLLRSFDGPFPLLRPGAAFARATLPLGLTRRPPQGWGLKARADPGGPGCSELQRVLGPRP